MNLITESIISYIKDTFKKDLDDLLLSDVLLVEYLTVDGLGYDNKRIKVSYQDLKIFKNLKYLEIRDITITKDLISILKELDYLENITFRNCIFKIKNLNDLVNIKCIRIINCIDFNLTFINKLDNLNRIYISGEKFNNLKGFNKMNLKSLDISECELNKSLGIDKINVGHLVISSKQYNDFKNEILELNNKIMVMADPQIGYYIEKWIN